MAIGDVVVGKIAFTPADQQTLRLIRAEPYAARCARLAERLFLSRSGAKQRLDHLRLQTGTSSVNDLLEWIWRNGKAIDEALGDGSPPVPLAEAELGDPAWGARPGERLPREATPSRLGDNEEPPPEGEDEDTKRRNFLKFAAVAPVVAPEVLSRVLADAAAEAMAWTRHAGASMLGRTTFDHLESVLARLDGAYGKESPADLFNMARAYRAQVADMIQGRHTLREGRELYVYAAWLSRRLAWLAQDLGAPGTAEAYAIDCFGHAEEAGQNELCGWAMDAMSVIAEFDRRLDDAIAAARRGMAKVPASHPLAVRLRAQAATAQARLGKRQECENLLVEATQLYERLPSGFTGAAVTAATFAVTAYPASAYVRLGDFARAKTSAEQALSARPSRADDRWATQEALTRVDLGLALTGLGSPDEAAGQGRLALSSRGGVKRVASKAGDLDRVLTTRYPDLPDVRDFHERYRQTVLQGV